MFLRLQSKSLVFPDLATTETSLSSWEKFKLASNNTVAIPTVATALLAAGFSQAIDKPAGYHQGMAGYGKRFGADMARVASTNLFGTFLIASVTHEDPRFYVKSQLDFQQSLKYAALRLVVTRSDAGDPVVNYSGLLGPLAAEGLANVYYPQGDRGLGSTLIRYSADLGWRVGGNLLRQYWPLINKKLELVPEERSKTSANQ